MRAVFAGYKIGLAYAVIIIPSQLLFPGLWTHPWLRAVARTLGLYSGLGLLCTARGARCERAVFGAR